MTVAVTCDFYAPYDSGPGSNVTEDGWREFMQIPTVSGVIRNKLNELKVYGDSTGMQVKVMTGVGWIQGQYAKNTTEKTLPIAAAHPTLLRLDRVVLRNDFVNNVMQLDVLTNGSPGSAFAPDVTRNTSIWEISLGVVAVPAAAVTIASGNVQEARQFGGVPAPPQSDDQVLHGDRLSTSPRWAVQTTNSMTNGIIYVSRLTTLTDTVVGTIRTYITTGQVGGASAFGIYVGYGQADLQRIVTPTLPLTGLGVRIATFTPVTIQAGMQVAIAALVTGASTQPFMGSTTGIASLAGGNDILNPTGTGVVTTAFKSGQSSLPSTMNLGDGSWTSRDRIPWFALA